MLGKAASCNHTSQDRRAVEQLRTEAGLERMKVSAAPVCREQETFQPLGPDPSWCKSGKRRSRELGGKRGPAAAGGGGAFAITFKAARISPLVQHPRISHSLMHTR